MKQETIQSITDIEPTVEQDIGETEKSIMGRPLKQIYIENMPLYKTLLAEHMRNGGATSTFSGYVFNHFYKQSNKNTEFAVDNTPSRDWFDQRLNPSSKYFDPDFSAIAHKVSASRDLFWQHTAVIANVNPSKYQLYMANNYGWKLRQDVTSDDEKIEAPVIYTPEKHETIEGIVVEGEVIDEA